MKEKFISTGVTVAKGLVPALAKTAPIGVALGGLAVGGIEAEHHRKKTHHVLQTPKILEKAFHLEQRSMGIPDVGEWEQTHRDHHTEPDMSLTYALDIWRAWAAFRTTHPHSNFELPDSVPFIDPYISQFPIEELLRVGQLSEEKVAARMGSDYEELKNCTEDKLKVLLTPTKPTYFYPPREKYPKGHVYTQREKARALTSDPHSLSLLHPQESFWSAHFGLYQDRANLFLAHPELKDEDLHTDDENNRKSSVPYVVGGIIVPALITLAVRRKVSVGDLLIAGAVGGAIYGERAWTEVQAGKFVNYFGHLADIDEKTLKDILRNRLFYLVPNLDGTASSDLVNAGKLGKFIGFLTGGDGGKQKRHHKKPEANLFSDQTGLRAFGEDPIGVTLEAAVKHGNLTGFKEGDQFNLEEGERRPDDESEAAEIVHEQRRRELEAGTTPITWRRLFPHKGEFADVA